MNTQKEKIQFQESQAVIDLNQIPNHVLKGIGSRILKILKTDKSLQESYETETGKTYYK